MLVEQSTKWPIRKVWAVIIAGAVIGGVQSALGFVPGGKDFIPFVEEFDVWIQLGVMSLAGYFVKEKA